MNSTLPLQTLYQQNWKNLDVVTPLDELMREQVGKVSFSCSSMEQLIANLSNFEVRSVWDQIEIWRETLALIIIACLNNCLEQYQEPLKIKILELMKNGYWEEFQLETALRALCFCFLDLPIKIIAPHQLPSGAIPLEFGQHWPWADGPHSHFQAELGILWFILGILKDDPNFIDASKKAADWQLNTLDYHFSPFKGLYVQENDASSTHLLANNYLLFHSVGMDVIGKKMLHELELLADKTSVKIPPYAVLMEAWIYRQKQTLGESVNPLVKGLPTNIYDSQTVLAGYRSPEFSLVLTLSGGGTGMGAIHQRDVHLVSYGPQHMPLGDCRGFGIETSENSKPEVSSKNDQLELKNIVRLASKPTNGIEKALFRYGKHSGLWMEAKQSFVKSKLNIEAMFLGISQFENIAFTFFARALTCYVDQTRVNPRSIERYQGKSLPVRLEGEGEKGLKIQSIAPVDELHIIPLAGKDSFWGADFLVAYILSPNRINYSWQVEIV